MSATLLYTLQALPRKGQTGIMVLYASGRACSLTWYSSLERARHRASTKVWPTGREVDQQTWETEWYRRNQPSYYRIVEHPNGGYYAHLWPFKGGPLDFGQAIDDERVCGAFEDKEQLRREIELRYRGAQPVEGETAC